MVKANCNASPAAGHVATHALSGKIRKNHGPEYAEMQLYLSKLKELVPHVPKNKKVSKLEVIQHVIDYICDLQWALESHPAMRGAPSAVQLMEAADSEVLNVPRPHCGASDASSASPIPASVVPNAGICQTSQSETSIANAISHSRTPLGVLPPTQNSTAVPSHSLSRPESKA